MQGPNKQIFNLGYIHNKSHNKVLFLYRMSGDHNTFDDTIPLFISLAGIAALPILSTIV
jgi:hypothetical protein